MTARSAGVSHFWLAPADLAAEVRLSAHFFSYFPSRYAFNPSIFSPSNPSIVAWSPSAPHLNMNLVPAGATTFHFFLNSSFLYSERWPEKFPPRAKMACAR